MAENKTEKTRAAAYCRVSTKDAEQLKSFEHQKEYFNEIFEESKEYDLYKIYTDKGKTGTKLDRPGFSELLKDAGLDIRHNDDGGHYLRISKPKFEIILVKNTSRFARHDAMTTILQSLVNNGVDVKFIDTDTRASDPNANIVLGLMAVVDKAESADKSRKTSFGMLQGAKNNNILCNGKIHGYDYSKDNKTLMPNEEAPHIKQMFELYAKGIGSLRIANILKEEGTTDKNGKYYTANVIRNILANEKYYGTNVRNRYDTGKVFNKNKTPIKRPDKELKRPTDKIEPIITEDLFNKCKEIKESRTEYKQRKGKSVGTSTYGSKLYCASCGKRYWARELRTTKKGPERDYACKGKYDDPKCTNPNVTETFLNDELSNEEYTMQLADSFVAAQKFLVELRSELLAAINDKSANKKLIKAEAEHEENLRVIEELMDLSTSGIGAKEVAKKKIDDISKKDDKIVAEIDRLKKSENEQLEDMAKIEESMNEIAERVKEIYDEVEVDEFGVHYVDYNVPYAVLPKKQFTQEEILEDIDRIEVSSSRTIKVKFKTFAEIEKIVERHKGNMGDRITAIFEEIKADGWDRVYSHYSNSTWLR